MSVTIGSTLERSEDHLEAADGPKAEESSRTTPSNTACRDDKEPVFLLSLTEISDCCFKSTEEDEVDDEVDDEVEDEGEYRQ